MERMKVRMLEAIREADPETAKRIVLRLQELHERNEFSAGG